MPYKNPEDKKAWCKSNREKKEYGVKPTEKLTKKI